MWKDFKAFLLRGNVVDLAVGIVIGAAFGAIVSSFVKDILMPPIGLLLGKVDFANRFITLSGQKAATLADAQAAGAVTMNYGLFINTLINFLIVAIAIFFVVKAIERMRKPAPAAAPTPAPATKDCPYCLSAIKPEARRCPYCTSELTS